jgi:hypothetical protein
MCRWMVFIANHEVLIADVVTKPYHSIISMSHEHYLPDIAKVRRKQRKKAQRHSSSNLLLFFFSSLPSLSLSLSPELESFETRESSSSESRIERRWIWDGLVCIGDKSRTLRLRLHNSSLEQSKPFETF